MLLSAAGVELEGDGEHRGFVVTNDHENDDFGAVGGREQQGTVKLPTVELAAAAAVG